MSHCLRSTLCGLFLIGFTTATGCSSYVIKGTVISGSVSDMLFVESNDSRLREPPLTNVRLTVQRNPDDLNRQMAGTDISDAHGRFVITLDEFGTGWMDEVWLIRATKGGFKTASSRQRLDAEKKQLRLLVIMAPGLSSAPQEEEDLMEEYREYR
ncbi:MAG: hypothetical protein ACYSUF_01335 [Planctomycetota bacterium]